MLGYIPGFLFADDPHSATVQLSRAYQHGGGWSPFKGHTMLPNGDLKYPGDPPTRLLAEARLREETIRIYDFAWVAVIQPDGTFEVCRMD
jgi:hypothetical protein